jgi:predicted permease
MFHDFLQDLRFGFRMLNRNPGFSILAIVCLTLGIGANAAVFSWIEGVLLRPFPLVADQDRMVAVAGTRPGGDKGSLGFGYTDISYPDFLDYRKECKLMDWFIVDRITGTTLSIGDRAERVSASIVSSNYFDAIGVRPVLGRGFQEGDDVGRNAHPVAVISHWLWTERFNSDPTIVGKVQMLNGVKHTIIGVAPDGFHGTFVGFPMQFWVPASMQEIFNPGGYKLEDRGQTWIEGYARLKPGVTIDQAQAEIASVAKRLEHDYPATNRGRGVQLLPLWKTPFNQAGELAPTLKIALAVVFLVLLIACANVSSLLLVRSLARRHEMTVRLAIGSKRGRLLRQLLTEGLILSTIAGIGGLIVAFFCRNLLVVFFPSSGVVAANLSGKIDWRVLAFSAVICIISTMMFGLVPALQGSKIDLASALKADSVSSFGGRGKARFRSGLVLVQVALSFILLVGGVLLIESLGRIRSADPGFYADNIVTTFFDFVSAGYNATRAKNFQEQLVERVQQMPGVESAAMVRIRPFSYAAYFSAPIVVDNYQAAPDERPTAEYNQVSAGYFSTMGIPIVSGREFTRADTELTFPAVVVNQQMVNKYWHGEDPVGKRIQVKDKWMQVIGVVKTSKYSTFSEAPKPFFFVSSGQDAAMRSNLVLRTSREPGSMTADLTQQVHALDAGLGLNEVITMRQHINRSALANQQIVVALLMIFGGIALGLAAIGLYGVMSYSVSQGKRELGLRMALGAGAPHLFRLVLSHGLVLMVGGVFLGGVAALVLTRQMDTLLYKVNPRDPMAFGFAFVVMSFISLTACFLPAWRATRTNPVQALRD